MNIKKITGFFLVVFSLCGISHSGKAQGVGWMTFDTATFGESLLSAVRQMDELTAMYDNISRLGGTASDVMGIMNSVSGSYRSLLSDFNQLESAFGRGWDSDELLSTVLLGDPTEIDIFKQTKDLMLTGRLVSLDSGDMPYEMVPELAISDWSDHVTRSSDLARARASESENMSFTNADAALTLHEQTMTQRAPEAREIAANSMSVMSLQNDALQIGMQRAELDIQESARAKEDAEQSALGSFRDSQLNRYRIR
jgi:hypothetical protein